MVYILLADGFEEIEAITPIDILKRCGVEVITVGVLNKQVRGAHNILVEADILIGDVDKSKMDMLILPGGAGYEILDASNDVHELINYCVVNGINIGAICAAPSILGKKGLLTDKKATCFPGFEKYMYGAQITGQKVECDGIYITARGAGCAAEFGFTLAKILAGDKTALNIKGMMQY